MIPSLRHSAVVFLILTLAMVGCGKRDEAPQSDMVKARGEPTISAHEPTLVPGDPGLERVMQSTVEDLERMAQEAQEAGGVVVKEAQAQVERLIAELRDLIAAQRYLEAREVLQKLLALEATEEQQQQIHGLKAELEKNLSGKALEEGRRALGGLLDGKR
jgi:DNA repair exonuclease SbcCD ATPase subunit